MYSQIWNPVQNKFIDLKTKNGLNILRSFVNYTKKAK